MVYSLILSLLVLPFAISKSNSSQSTVYLIRHGEKPDSGDGLSAAGLKRAQCLRTVFGKASDYDVGYILAQAPKKSGKRTRPLDTVSPLAADLGLTVDTSCDRDDAKCVEKAVKNWDGTGNVLICWEHGALTDIVEELGGKKELYPDESFNLIWTDPYPYQEIADITNENCPGLEE